MNEIDKAWVVVSLAAIWCYYRCAGTIEAAHRERCCLLALDRTYFQPAAIKDINVKHKIYGAGGSEPGIRVVATNAKKKDGARETCAKNSIR
jgi:hypothetical protein